MSDHLSPYQAFQAQTQLGDSRWWTWLIVFWFGLVVWLYGQMLFGIPLIIIGAVIDPGSLEAMMAGAPVQTPAQAQAGMLAGVLAFGAPLISVLLWLLREQFEPPTRSKVLKIAGGLAAMSGAAVVYMLVSSGGGNEMEVINSWMAQSPWIYLFVLLMFPPLAIGLWLGQKRIHGRTILSLHTAAKKFRWRRLAFSMGVFWAIALGLSYILHATGLNKAEVVFDASKFWAYLPITLIFIPLQSATEEIALRGYLNQGLGHYIKNPWVVFFITSAAFAALHLGNPEVAEGAKETSKLVVMSGYFFFGMFACVLVYIDGGLETAIGVHAANNMFAAAFMGYENSALPTPTIYRVGLDTQLDSLTTIAALSLVCLIMYLTRRPFTPHFEQPAK